MASIKNKKLFDDIIKNVDDISNFKFAKKTDNEIDKVVIQFIDKLRRQIEKDGTEASGALKASIAPLPTLVGTGVVKIRIELDPYWKDVDQGSKPKGNTKENLRKLQPKIFNWIQSKGSLAKIAIDKDLKRSLSYAIAKSILKKGTIKRFGYKGSGFVTNNLPAFKENIIKAFEKSLRIKK